MPFTMCLIFPQEKVTILRLVLFISPLVFVLGIQRLSRPMINLLVARYSPNECQAATAVAVLTATYPLGRMAYGWLNQLRTVSPTFQTVNTPISLYIYFCRLVYTLEFNLVLYMCSCLLAYRNEKTILVV